METCTAAPSFLLWSSLKKKKLREEGCSSGGGAACMPLQRLGNNKRQQAFPLQSSYPFAQRLRFKLVTISSSSAAPQAMRYGCCFVVLVPKVCMSRSCQVHAMSSGDRSSSGYGSGKPQPSLVQLCQSLQHCFFEICVHNMGRPAGQALHEFVVAAVNAFMAGFTFDKLSLQLAYGGEGMEEFKMDTAGYRLTSSEEHYRTQWLTTIYVTLQFLRVVDNEASRSAVTDDIHLVQVIHSQVKFDRGLATKGASGGAVAEKMVIAPQWVPVTQLVLLTLKVVDEAQ